MNVPAIYHNTLPPNITPSSSPGTLSTSTLYDCWQSNNFPFFRPTNRSHAPYPCRPHHGHLPQNQTVPLLCVTDHSSGHTEEWESLTSTRGATPKRRKTLPGVPGALTYSPYCSFYPIKCMWDAMPKMAVIHIFVRYRFGWPLWDLPPWSHPTPSLWRRQQSPHKSRVRGGGGQPLAPIPGAVGELGGPHGGTKPNQALLIGRVQHF